MEQNKKSNYLDTCDSVMGILAETTPGTPKILGSQTSMMEEMSQHAWNHGIQLVATGVEKAYGMIENHRLAGCSYDGKKWCQVESDIPSLWYDRLYSDLTKLTSEHHELKATMMKIQGLQFLNPLDLSKTVGDKFKFYEFCVNHAISSPFTSCINQDEPLLIINLIDTLKNIILKPRYGRKGIGIIRCGVHSPSSFYSSTHQNHIVSRSHHELLGVIRGMMDSMCLKPSDYIIQQTIHVASLHNRFCDVRCMVQRTGTDLPEVSAMVVRVSSGGMVSPNLDQKGIALDFSTYARAVFPQKDIVQFEQDAKDTALSVFKALESQVGHIAELGIDLIIDPSGAIHVIEANSKPGRIAYQRLAQGFYLTESERNRYLEMRHRTIENPIRYANHIIRSLREKNE